MANIWYPREPKRFPFLDLYDYERIAAIGKFLFDTEDLDTMFQKVTEPAPKNIGGTGSLRLGFAQLIKLLKDWETNGRDPKAKPDPTHILDACHRNLNDLNPYGDQNNTPLIDYPPFTDTDRARIKFLGINLFGKDTFPHIQNQAFKWLAYRDFGSFPHDYKFGTLREQFSQFIHDLSEWDSIAQDCPIVPRFDCTALENMTMALAKQLHVRKAVNPYFRKNP